MSFEVVGIRLTADGAGEFITTMGKADQAVVGFGEAARKGVGEAEKAFEGAGAAAGTYVDANGRMRDANGRFIKTAGEAGEAATGFGANVRSTFSQMPGLADIAVGAFHKVGAMAVEAFAAAGQAVAGFIKDSISVAGDFESGMNRFGAVAGDALADAGLSLKDFRDQFIQIGKELPVSTAEVQDAAIEMVKGGIDPATIAAGGLKQVIQFAAAADLDLAQASTIAAKALGGWTEASASADEKAQFLAHSTDLLAKAANASTVDVDELALGLYNVQGTAKSFGVSFDEVVTTLAEVSPAFASSADAGTAFSSFIKSLQPKTKPAIAALKSIGLYTDATGSAFYDAQGKFVGIRKASELLSTALGGLTDAQKAAIMPQIFGDGLRIASELADKGAAGFDTMAASMAKQSGVAEMAAQKQKGFNTALDNAKGSFEALQIIVGTKALPVLTNFLNNVVAPGINIITDLADAGHITQQTFDGLTPTMQKVASVISGAMATVQGAIDAAQKKIGTLKEVVRLWDSGIVSHKTLLQALGISAESAQIIDIIVTKARDLSGAFQGVVSFFTGGNVDVISGAFENIAKVIGVDATTAILTFSNKLQGAFTTEGIVGAAQVVLDKFAELSPAFAIVKGAAEAAFPAVQQIVADVFAGIQAIISEHGAQMLSDVQGIWQGIWDAVQTILTPLQSLVATVFGLIAEVIGENGDSTVSFITETWDTIADIIDVALKLISGVVAGVLIVLNEIIAKHGDLIKNIISNVWTIIKNTISAALEIIKGILTAALKIFQGDWEGAWNAIKTMSENVVKDLWEIIKAGLGLIANLFGDTLTNIGETWSHNWETFTDGVSRGADALVKLFTDLPDKLAGVGEAIVNSIWDGIKGKWDELVDWFNDKLDELKNQLPFSEPKDPSSPLRGLRKSGAAIVEMIGEGMRSAGPLPMQALVSPTASAAMAGMRAAGSSATYNQQRSVALTYNTAVAPPVQQSYAIAQAIVGAY